MVEATAGLPSPNVARRPSRLTRSTFAPNMGVNVERTTATVSCTSDESPSRPQRCSADSFPGPSESTTRGAVPGPRVIGTVSTDTFPVPCQVTAFICRSSRVNRVRADAHRDGFTGNATADVVINEGA